MKLRDDDEPNSSPQHLEKLLSAQNDQAEINSIFIAL
jgi:hypothetical protein